MKLVTLFAVLLQAVCMAAVPVPAVLTLSVRTNGVLAAPTNFWSANSNAIAAVVGSRGTSYAYDTNAFVVSGTNVALAPSRYLTNDLTVTGTNRTVSFQPGLGFQVLATNVGLVGVEQATVGGIRGTLSGTSSLELATPAVNAATAVVGQYLTLTDASIGRAEWVSVPEIARSKTYNAKTDYGCVGNGVTDDTTALQNAVNAAAAADRVLIIPSGTYIVSSLAPTTNLRVVGMGPATILKLKASSTGGIFRATPGSPVTNVYIADLYVDGNKANAASSVDHFRMGGANITLERVRIENANQAAINIGYDVSTHCHVRDCTVVNPANASNNYGGIAFTHVLHGSIVGCTVISSDGYMTYGIDVEPNSYAASENGNITIANNRVIGGQITLACQSATNGIPSNFAITGNVVDNSSGKGGNTTQVPPIVVCNAQNVTIAGNTLFDHATSTNGTCRGIYFLGALNVSVTGNSLTVRNTILDESVFTFVSPASTGSVTGNTINGVSTSSTQPRFLCNGQETYGTSVSFSGNRVVNFLNSADGRAFAGHMNVSVVNTTTETTLIGASGTGYGGSKYVPANSLTVGKAYRLTFGGLISTGSGGSTLTLRIKLGATTVLASSAITPSVTQSNKEWLVHVIVTGRASGASGLLTAMGMIYTDAAPTLVYSLRGTGGTTIDTTVDNAWDVTAQWGTGVTASDSISCNTFCVEPIN